MTQVRKSLAILKQEHDKYRRLAGRPFIHKKSGESYQVLFTAFDEETNEIEVIYVLSSMPWLKFSHDPETFLEKFEEGSAR